MWYNKKTILKDLQNLSKAVEPLYGPATAMRDPFMSGPPGPDWIPLRISEWIKCGKEGPRYVLVINCSLC